MERLITDEIEKMSEIQLKQQDFIGKGSFASVYRYKIHNTQLALKCFKDEKKAIEENAVLEKIHSLMPNCPGVIQYYGLKKLDIQIIGDFSGTYVGYIIFFQACLSDFQKMLEIVDKLKISEVFNVLSQMSLSLLCMHLNNCFHGDIKPSNILVNQNQQSQNIYYLTDYGEGKIVEELKQMDIKTLTLRGTPFYFAPELWHLFNSGEERTQYNPLATDIYALGIVILELLVGQKTILKLNSARLNTQWYSKELENIGNQLLKEYPEFQQNNDLLEIVLKMVNFEVNERPQIIQVCQALINQKQFQMDALQNCNLQAVILQLSNQQKSNFNPQSNIPQTQMDELQNCNLQTVIIELISSYGNQPKPNVNAQPNIPQPQKPLPDLTQPQVPPTCFKSDILKTSLHSNMILALFGKQNISLSSIHQQLNIENFDRQQFHKDCDNKGSTLVIMHSNEEPNSFFGGMAVPSWNSEGENIADPVDECSWLFKIEVEEGENMLHLHQWKCIKKDQALFGHTNYGPSFGGENGLFFFQAYEKRRQESWLISNNEYYNKVNLDEQLNSNTTGLLHQLRTQIACPLNVSRNIMSENYKSFNLDSFEVFSIKK